MDKLFRREIFHGIMDCFENKTQKVMFDSVDQSIAAVFGNMGGFEGEILTEIAFMPQYDDRDEEVIQIFSTLTDNIKEELFEEIEVRLNELNQKCMFGNFVLYRKRGQIYYRYTFPLKAGDKAYSLQLFKMIWNELYHTMDFFFAYVMLISSEKNFISLEEYMQTIEAQGVEQK